MSIHWAWRFVVSTLSNIQLSLILISSGASKYMVIGWNSYKSHIRMAILLKKGI